MVGAGAVPRVAGTIEDHPALQIGARVGYAVSGVLHLLIGWIALQVAWSGSGKAADQSGALQTLAGSSLGRLTLWVAVLGFFALGLWQFANGFAARSASGSSLWATRAKSLTKGIVYLVLAWTCFNFAKGKPSSSKAQSADFTATLLQQTGGRVLVAVVGLVVIGVGGYHVVKGWTKMFLQDLDGHPGALATRAGAVGYIAKGQTPRAMADLVLGLLQTDQECGQARARPNGFSQFPNSSKYDRVAELGPRHLEILDQVLFGCSNQEISTSIGLSLGTIKNYVSTILLAMDVKSRSHLISLFR